MGPLASFGVHAICIAFALATGVHGSLCAAAALFGGVAAIVPAFPFGIVTHAMCVYMTLHYMRAPPTSAGALVGGRSMGNAIDGGRAFLSVLGSGIVFLVLSSGANHTQTHASLGGMRAGWIALGALAAYHLGGWMAQLAVVPLGAAIAYVVRDALRARAEAAVAVTE